MFSPCPDWFSLPWRRWTLGGSRAGGKPLRLSGSPDSRDALALGSFAGWRICVEPSRRLRTESYAGTVLPVP